MKYDFETVIDRHGQDALAVDNIDFMMKQTPEGLKEGFDFIPMWVADMNFPTARSIQDEIIRRAEHPAFGYFRPRQEYFDAILSWHEKQKGVSDLKSEDIGYENGVLGGVISALKVFASPGDPVLLHSPTYVGFTHAIESNGFHIVHSPLQKDEQGVWRMDYENMARTIEENHIHVCVMCNPHNPCGRVWTRKELEEAVKVFEAHDVWVISDEIWSDLIMKGNRYTPLQSVNAWSHDHTIAFYAPSKTFNLAGLVGSYHVIYNRSVRERVQAIGQKTVYNAMNVLSMHALIGAYSEEGENWLHQLLEVLTKNIELASGFINTHLEGVSVFPAEGTYMLFLDCRDYLKAHDMSIDELLRKGWSYGVGWQDGRQFQAPGFIRLNLASPTHRIEEALHRMDAYIF
jgi:cystathionine beta-lyase